RVRRRIGAPGGTRTHDLQVRNLTLYPLSYGRMCRSLGDLAEREGFEPSKQVTPLNGLANRRTRPLCDLSAGASEATTGSRSASLRTSRGGTNMPGGPTDETAPLVSDEQLQSITVGERKPHNASVTLVEYDPAWPALYEREAVRIRGALG